MSGAESVQPQDPNQPTRNDGLKGATFTEMLEAVPLHSERAVADLAEPNGDLEIPQDIHVHCDDPKCEGIRRHHYHSRQTLNLRLLKYHYLLYTCTNCQKQWKVFGLRCVQSADRAQSGVCTKIYQEPTFGEPIPPRLFDLIGQDNRQHFLNARRAIARSLGIGAFAYYRRIVEDAKFNLISTILATAEAVNSSPEQIARLKEAQKENQFSKAIEILRAENAIPPFLLIDGHNPLLLLHNSLSEGIHAMDDAECLERARHAEVLLCEIALRLQAARAERKSLKQAIAGVRRLGEMSSPLSSAPPPPKDLKS